MRCTVGLQSAAARKMLHALHPPDYSASTCHASLGSADTTNGSLRALSQHAHNNIGQESCLTNTWETFDDANGLALLVDWCVPKVLN